MEKKKKKEETGAEKYRRISAEKEEDKECETGRGLIKDKEDDCILDKVRNK
jgi:hypothetical protein